MGLLDRLKQALTDDGPRLVQRFMPQSTILPQLLDVTRLTHVVDVVANPIDGEPPYQGLLKRGLCRVTGFEPQPEALAELEAKKSANERYLPFAVGDGQRHTLRVCRGSGMTSLFAPNRQVLALFPALLRLAEVTKEVPIETKRLDDLAELEPFDYLKIDVQGAELAVFQDGRQKLANACILQTEVSWIALYEGQPTFGDVDLELRRQGFLPHTFAGIKTWPVAPYVHDEDPMMPVRQLLESDAVYIRDLTRPEALSNEQLQHLAIVAEQCYGSVDIALRCLQLLEQRHATPADARTRYVDWMRSQGHPARG